MGTLEANAFPPYSLLPQTLIKITGTAHAALKFCPLIIFLSSFIADFT
jgi:hypothetical protein